MTMMMGRMRMGEAEYADDEEDGEEGDEDYDDDGDDDDEEEEDEEQCAQISSSTTFLNPDNPYNRITSRVKVVLIVVVKIFIYLRRGII